MVVEKIAGKEVKIYDSIDELPISRFHAFNKYLLVDSGIGSNLNDINDHIYKVGKYIDAGDTENAKKQLENFRQSLFLVASEINYKHLSIGPLIHSVNGVARNDLSTEGIKETVNLIKRVKKNRLDRLIEAVKKKIDKELDLYFPGHFNTATVKEYHDKIRQRLLYQLGEIIRNEDNSSKIDQIDFFLISLAKPQIFYGSGSEEIKYDKQFEEMCLFLSKEVNRDAKNMTVLEFYNSFEYVKKINNPKNGRKPNKI